MKNICSLFYKVIKELRHNGFYITWYKVINVIRSRKRCSIDYSGMFYDAQELKMQQETRSTHVLKFSILTPLYNTPEKFLQEMIDSVLMQTYSNWELCLADGSDAEHSCVGEICRVFAAQDKRIKYKKLLKNGGIAENSNACAEMASGDYFGLLDHDDVLSPAALYEVAQTIDNQDADFIYTDEVQFNNSQTRLFNPAFKPDFSAEELNTRNYICHFMVFSRLLWGKSGGFRSEFDGSQDYDLALRLTERAHKIAHISMVLYLWRSHAGSTALNLDTKVYAIEAAKNAIREHLRRNGEEAEVEESVPFRTVYRIRYKLNGSPIISIIVLQNSIGEDVSGCVSVISRALTYNNVEIISADKGNCDDIYSSNFYEYVRNHANGSYYLFIDSRLQSISADAIEEMLMLAQKERVGAVSPKTCYRNNSYIHAGLTLSANRRNSIVSWYGGESVHNFGYQQCLYHVRRTSAVWEGCMMTKADLWKQSSGFLGAAKGYAGIDYCLRLRDNYKVETLWTPYAKAVFKITGNIFDESINSKAADEFYKKWKIEISTNDPNLNIHLYNSGLIS